MSNANTSPSVLFTIGTGIGKAGAYAFEGTRLASTQLAQGAQAGYIEKAAELRAKRQAILAQGPALSVPALPTKQKRVAA